MTNLEIIVENKRFDYQDRNDFGLLFRKTVTTGLTNRSDTVSFTVNFPATQNNLEILGLNLSMDNYLKFYKDKPYNIEVIVNSTSLVNGILIVQSYSKDIIQCIIVSFGISLVSLIQNKSLNDLNIDSIPFYGGETLLENLGEQVLNLSVNGSSLIHSLNSPFNFPLISYGNYFIPNRPIRRHDIDTTSLLSLVNTYELNQSEVSALKFSDVPPSVYYTRIFKQIFEDIGYVVGGSLINSKDVINLIVPCLGRDETILNLKTLGGFQLRVYSNVQTPNNTTLLNSRDKLCQSASPPEVPILPPSFLTLKTLLELLNIDSLSLDYNYGLTHTYPSELAGPFDLEPYLTCPTDGEYQLSFKLGQYDLVYTGSDNPTRNTVPAIAMVRVNEEDEDNMVNLFYFNTDNHIIVNSIYSTGINAVMLPPIGGSPDLGPPTNISPSGPPYRKVFPNLNADNIVLIYNLNDLDLSLSSSSAGDFVTHTGTFNANKGDRYKLILVNGSANVTSIRDNRYKITVKSDLRFNIDLIDANIFPDTYDGVDLNPNINLPDISQSDFIRDAISRLNLYFIVNEDSKIIYFETLDKFYEGQPYELKGKLIEAAQKEVPERLQFNFNYDSDDYLTKGESDLNFTKRSEMRYIGNIETISTILSKTDLQQYGIIQTSQNTNYADFINKSKTYQSAGVAPIQIPQISDFRRLNSLQDRLIIGGELIESFQTLDLNYAPRLLRINGYYNLSGVPPSGSSTIGGLPIRYLSQLGPNFFPTPNAPALQKDIVVNQQFITSSDNVNLDLNYLYNTYYNNLITELQAGEIVKFSVYLTYIDFIELRTNRLVQIDGILYRIIEFQPFNPINPKPIEITLQKVL